VGRGWLAIDAVDVVVLAALSDADAAADGFVDLGAMLDVLRSLYPDTAADGKKWFRVRFRVTEPTRTVASTLYDG
jgi:hypothetical protein